MKISGGIPSVKPSLISCTRALKVAPVALLLALTTGCVSDYYFAADTADSGVGSGSSGSSNSSGSGSSGSAGSASSSGSASSGSSGSGGGTGPKCSTVLMQTTANLRIAFMVDNSGSTVGVGGTDPNYTYRSDTITTFLNTYGSKTNFTYSYGFFSDDAEVYDMTNNVFVDITSGGTPASSYSTSAGLTAATTAFKNGSFQNLDTYYNRAFAALQSIITTDVAANGTKYQYVVVFMSDGMPNPSMSIPQLQTLVDNVLSAAGGKNQATVSTVYFGPNDTGAEANLQAMATEGNGQFVNTNVNSNIAISDLITVPGTVCQAN